MAWTFHLSFQDATSPIREEYLHFHNHTCIIVFFLKSSVSLYYFTHTNKQTHTNRRDVQEVKTIWTIFPAIILILITLPSLSLFFFPEIYFSCGPFLKVSIEFVTILFLFYVLVFWRKGTWDPGFLTREWTGTPAQEGDVLTTGPPPIISPSLRILQDRQNHPTLTLKPSGHQGDWS